MLPRGIYVQQLSRPYPTFFQEDFLKGGFRAGKAGLIKAGMDAIYQFIILSKLYEQKKDTRIQELLPKEKQEKAS